MPQLVTAQYVPSLSAWFAAFSYVLVATLAYP
jgi:hypothetical protein